MGVFRLKEGKMKQFVKDAQNKLRLIRPWLHILEDDVFKIGERLREIEDGYFIVYDTRANRYEVHSAYNRGSSTYAFIVPYDELDSRTIDYCIRTRVANTDRLLKEMEENNRKIRESSERKFHNDIEAASLETATDVSYAMDKDVLHTDYKKTFGGVAI